MDLFIFNAAAAVVLATHITDAGYALDFPYSNLYLCSLLLALFVAIRFSKLSLNTPLVLNTCVVIRVSRTAETCATSAALSELCVLREGGATNCFFKTSYVS